MPAQRTESMSRLWMARRVALLACTLTAVIPGPSSASGQAPHPLREPWQAGLRLDDAPPAARVESAPSETAEPESWTLDPARLPDGPDAPGDEARIEQIVRDAWVLGRWSPSVGEAHALGSLPAHFALTAPAPASAPGPTRRDDRWATDFFRRDAELLTPLAEGRELLSWELGNRWTLSGVGSRRVWTERDRALVISAEAGVRFNARAGLQVGYEVLQASTLSGLEPEGAESVFARFQVRF